MQSVQMFVLSLVTGYIGLSLLLRIRRLFMGDKALDPQKLETTQERIDEMKNSLTGEVSHEISQVFSAFFTFMIGINIFVCVSIVVMIYSKINQLPIVLLGLVALMAVVISYLLASIKAMKVTKQLFFTGLNMTEAYAKYEKDRSFSYRLLQVVAAAYIEVYIFAYLLL